MSRVIKFRGKDIDDGQWRYGQLFFWTRYNKSNPVIGSGVQNGSVSGFEVDPESVGQFTGLYDSENNEIYEGDIIKTSTKEGVTVSIGDIQFSHGVFGAEWTRIKENRNMVGSWGQLHNLITLDTDIIEKVTVIGNIYENPELLK